MSAFAPMSLSLSPPRWRLPAEPLALLRLLSKRDSNVGCVTRRDRGEEDEDDDDEDDEDDEDENEEEDEDEEPV